MAQKYKTIRIREDVLEELHKYIAKRTPKPPGRPPTISDAVLALLKGI